jgi:hypothetical protein
MSPSRRTVPGNRALQGVLAAALVLGGAELATRLAYNEGTVRAKVAESARRAQATFDQDTDASRISLVAAGARPILD